MGRKSVETLVGVFVLLGMLGLLFLALKAANLSSIGGGDTYTLTAYAPGGQTVSVTISVFVR